MSIQLEDVAIEAVHVGDFVILEDATGRADRPVCVLGLTTTRHRQTNRVIGWLVEVEGGESLWLRRGARVTRRVSADDRRSARRGRAGAASNAS